MEDQIVNVVLPWVFSMAAKYPVISIIIVITGGIYWTLTTFRAGITTIVKLTKTSVDDTVIAKIFAICDKFSWGFGPLEDYFEAKTGIKK